MGCLTANDGHVSYRRLAAGDQIRGGGSRDFASGPYLARGEHLREAGTRPHPTVQAAPAGAAGNNDGVKVSGDRSSGVNGFVATVSKVCVAWHLRQLHMLTRLLGMLA